MLRASWFDVLIVYSSTHAASAGNIRAGKTPFANSESFSSYADSYAYLLDQCTASNLRAAFVTLNDIKGPGTAKSYWTHSISGWSRSHGMIKAQIIFDKCSPRTTAQIRQRNLLFSSTQIVPFNEIELYNLFFDKLTLHESLYTVTIPTVEVEAGNLLSADSAITRLEIVKSIHANNEDFDSGYVLKDRYGSGGNNIFPIKYDDRQHIMAIVASNPTVNFVLQPMVMFEHGFSYKNSVGKTEIRLIYMKEKLVQVYLRTAAPQEFLCNGHQGGVVTYVPTRQLSNKIKKAALRTIELLPPHNSLYSLDFVVSDRGNPYLLEGNTGPGLNWDKNDIHDIRGAKKVIRVIVEELLDRVVKNKSSKKYLPSSYNIVQNASV